MTLNDTRFTPAENAEGAAALAALQAVDARKAAEESADPDAGCMCHECCLDTTLPENRN